MPDLMEILKYKGEKGRKMADKLKKYYRNAIIINSAKTEDIPVGAGKMGGFPDLPPEIEYPTMSEYTKKWLKGFSEGKTEHYEKSAMQLVAQINLYELAESGADVENLLPKNGMLYIFWSGEIIELKRSMYSEIDCIEPENNAIHKVIYWDGNMSTLKRTPPPCPYYSKYFEEYFEEYGINFVSSPEYSEESAVEIEGLEELTDTDVYDFSEYCNKMLGFIKGANKPDIDENMVNLFQFDYNMGCLWFEYWLINKKDLKNLDFSRVSFSYDMD